jgi:Ca-activated chloride channel family protein
VIPVRPIVILALAAAVQPPPAFHVETRLVVLHATVLNDRGEHVTGLERAAFTVFENGKPQPITLFRSDDVPVSLGLLIDNSGSMRPRRARVEAAALAFARASNPEDELFVVNFADKARLDVPFTSDLRVLESGIARVDSIGGTAMRDAVDMAEGYLHDHAARDRRVLIVVTDGNDNASITTLDRIRTRAEQLDVVVYAVGLLNDGDPSKARQARHDLDELAAATGGVAYYPDTLERIGEVALDLARQIRSQYTMAYAPTNQALDGTYRRIHVAVKGASRMVVRTRAGYRATPDMLGASSKS